MQTLFGGGGSSQAQSSASGFSQLPPSLQNAFSNLGTQATNTVGNPSSAASMFTLPALSAPASSALSQIQNQNFAITPQSINTAMSEQMNPYNDSVINQIEKAQNGTESQLNSYLTDQGQFGSNRGMLGASDISNTAANQIGSFLNPQFNTAMQNALTTIPNQNAQSAQGAVQGGLLQQQQVLQNQMAPVSALQSLGQVLGTVGMNGGSVGSGGGTSNQQNGMFASFSDIRLKKNIEYVGKENGHNVYRFIYVFDKDNVVYQGAMAQEILDTVPDAVLWNGEHFSVDYAKIGVEFRRA